MDKQLTEREQQVVDLVLQGLTNKQIANELVITVHTVKCHLVKIFMKLGCQRGKVDLFIRRIQQLEQQHE